MTSRHFERLRDVLGEALECPSTEREAFVREACADDPALLDEILRILGTSDPTDFLSDEPLPAERSFGRPRTLGSFEILHPIGRGASAVVYLARHTSLEHKVAIKVLDQNFAPSREWIDRFEREPRRVARFDHPHIVKVFEVGESGPYSWFAMEFVDGHDLDEELQRTVDPRPDAPTILPKPGEAGRFRAIAELIRDAALALHHAHTTTVANGPGPATGIVHRDIKPSNLLLERRTRNVKVTDFGIARGPDQESLTRTGSAVGTLPYMSPEQAKALQDIIDHRTDIYSLGVVLYELLALRRPHESSSLLQLRHMICEHEPPSLLRRRSGVPWPLAAITHTAIEKSPERRYATAKEMADDLQRMLDHEPVRAQPPGVLTRSRFWCYRHRRTLIVAALILLASLISLEIRSHVVNIDRVETVHRMRAELETDDLFGLLDGGARAGQTTDQLRPYIAALLGAPDAESLDPLRVEADALRDQIVTRARRLASLARNQDGDLDLQLALESIILATIGASLFPRDDELIELGRSSGVLPSISVSNELSDGSTVTGRAELLRLDPRNGLPTSSVDLGPLPVETLDISRGVFRIVVTVDGGRRLEMTRIALFGQRIDIELPVTARSPLPVGDMVQVNGQTLRVRKASPLNPLQGQSIALQTFLIDRHEVTNASYRAFLEATDETPPYNWEAILQRWGETRELPAVGMSWRQAQRFAEWRGARLPTFAEFTLAASGPDNWQTPWQEALPVESEFRGNVGVKTLPTSADDPAARVATYLQMIQPAISSPEAATASGLLHMLGNVSEWTESPPIEPSPAGDRTMARQRICAGYDVRALSNRYRTLRGLYFQGLGDSYESMTRGFRCVRSIAP